MPQPDLLPTAPLLSLEAEARAGLHRILRGEPPTDGAPPWTVDDLVRLWALCKLGRPADVVSNGPAPVIAKGDNWGGRMSMPGEGTRAAVLHAWREVSRESGVPMASPQGDGKVAGRR